MKTAHRGQRHHRYPIAITVVAILFLIALAVIPVSNASWTGTASATMSLSTDDALAFETGLFGLDDDLAWWLDASRTTTQYSDTGCTTPSAAGGAVACWQDRRPGRSSVISPTTAPVRSTTPIGGVNSVFFDSTDSLAGPDLLGGSSTTATIFVVSRENARVQNILFNLNGTADGSPGRFSLHVPWSDGRVYFDAGNVSTYRSSYPGLAVGATTLVTAWQDPGDNKNHLQLNDGAIASSGSTGAAATAGGLNLGSLGSFSVNHDIAEVLVFTTTLSPAERTTINAYLQQKWGTP